MIIYYYAASAGFMLISPTLLSLPLLLPFSPFCYAAC